MTALSHAPTQDRPVSTHDHSALRPTSALSNAELLVLFDRWQQDRDPTARRRLVERFMPLARQLARRYAGTTEPLDDLIGVANLGLVKAIDRFDGTRGAAFSSFAVPTILGELRRHFRDTGWSLHVPRGAQERALRVEHAIKELGARDGRDPTPQILSEYLEWSMEDVIEALEAGGGHHASSLDAPVRDDAGEVGTVLSTVGAEDDEFEMVDARLTLAQAIGTLPLSTRKVIEMRFAEDLTQSEIGERLGVSQMQVSRILRGALKQVREQTDSSV